MIIEPGLGVTRVNTRRILRGLVTAGYAVISSDFGGAHQWGNALNRARIDAVIAWAATLGFKTDKIGIMDESMGHFSMYNWGHRNQTKVAACVAAIPAVDGDQIYASAGFQTQMNAAHGGSWLAASSTHNPIEMTVPSWAAHWWIYYAPDETIAGCGGTPANALATYLGQAGHAIAGGTGGHNDTVWSTISTQTIVDKYNAGVWV